MCVIIGVVKMVVGSNVGGVRTGVREDVGTGVNVLVTSTSPEPGCDAWTGLPGTLGGVSNVRVTNWVGVSVGVGVGSGAPVAMTGIVTATISRRKVRRMSRFFMIILPDLCIT